MVFQWRPLRFVFNLLDKRRLQEELDYHRLYLLTSYYDIIQRELDSSSSSDDRNKRKERLIKMHAIQGMNLIERLDYDAQTLGLEGTRREVGRLLHTQMDNLARQLHEAFGTEAKAAEQWRLVCETIQLEQDSNGGGLNVKNEDAVSTRTRAQKWGAAASEKGLDGNRSRKNGRLGHLSYSGEDMDEMRRYSAADIDRSSAPVRVRSKERTRSATFSSHISGAMLETCGFSLKLAKSTISHEDSGDGLFIEGTASVGQILAIYPGIAYSMTHHSSIPGYPLVAQSNSFLLSRFDGTILDATPWGRGKPDNNLESSGSDSLEWPQSLKNVSEVALSILEGRNPLALAHFANHPPANVPPNVVVAPLDWCVPSDQSWLRVYLPCISYPEPKGVEHLSDHIGVFLNNQSNGETRKGFSQGLTSISKVQQSILNGLVSSQHVKIPTVVLVASRFLENEEIFLNYRLNPKVPTGMPDWYHPVDAEEDSRRWA